MGRKQGVGEQVAYLVCVDVDPHKENEFCQEEAAAEVLVNCGSGALNLAEEPEGENAHGETNQRDDDPELSDPCQDVIIFNPLRANNNSAVKRKTE